ncbi:unnamed protein product [Phytophthora fragariaefolia]|uniref:Unnamed protein product n=1 Tax=Phytophthora fragariaefolia TaxID=1490495 RepID=A0A9W6XRX8_9STRA|nr:unnamed protein product [Phytophthora fragariaefolia]
MQDFIDSPAADMFTTGEPPASHALRRVPDQCELPEKHICTAQDRLPFAQGDDRSQIQADPKKMAAIAELPFPATKKGLQAFLGALNYYGRFIQNLAVYGAILYQMKEDDFAPGGDLTAAKAAFAELKTKRDIEFAQLVQASITPAIGLDETLKPLAPPSKNSATVRMDPELLYARIPTDYGGCVLSFEDLVKTEKNGGYDSRSWNLWRLPSWDIEIATSAHFPSATVNIAECTGMNNGVVTALKRGVSDLIIVGDSRLAIQQSMGVITCKKDALQVELARHKELTKKLNSVRYLHVVRLYNSAADSMATEALDAKAGRVVLSLERKAEFKALNKIPDMLYTCENSADIRRNSATIGKQSAVNSAERAEEPKVTATTRSQARRVRFKDEGASDEQPVRAFENPSKTPTQRESVRNEAAFGGAQSQVSNDTAELLTELSEARTPDASDIDPLVVQAERRQPQANGQQERSVKTMIQTVRAYVEYHLQADWDDIVDKLVHVIDNSRDSTRQETPFYLVHGWDARSTLKAMTESIRQGQTNSAETSDAAEWRREANRQREVALYLAAAFQRKEKARRAKEHNEALSRVEKEAVPRSVESPVESAITEETPTESETPEEPSAESPAESTRSLIKEGDQVWLFMERVKPGLTQKLALRWHGPFRVKKKIEEFAYEIELPDKSGYRFYPVVM